MISRIIKVSVRVISLSLRLRLITLTSTLNCSGYHKTSSNNCLLLYLCYCCQQENTSFHFNSPRRINNIHVHFARPFVEMFGLKFVNCDKRALSTYYLEFLQLHIIILGEGGNPLYGLYRFVRPPRVWRFSCFGQK